MKLTDLVCAYYHSVFTAFDKPNPLYVVDNRSWKPRERKQVDVGDFMVPSESAILSPQQRLAVYQFLISGIQICLCCS